MVFDGKKLAQEILGELKTETSAWRAKPTLAVVSLGEKADNSSYIIQKKKTAKFLDFGFKNYHYESSESSNQIGEYLNKITKQEKNSAVIVQMPLPQSISSSILNIIPLEKDADVLSDRAVGAFLNSRLEVSPPTPSAIFKILDDAQVEIKNKKVVIFGYGRLVGRFLVPMFLHYGAVVSVVEKGAGWESVLELSSASDIIVSATGEAKSITGAMIKKGAVVIDSGFSMGVDGKISGDVDLDSVKEKASWITPVPGGVGPVSVAELFSNVAKLFKLSHKKK